MANYDSEMEEEGLAGKFVVFLGYLWVIGCGAVELAIVLFVFSRLQERLEIIVVSILGLIYLTIRSVGFGLSMMFTKLVIGFEEKLLNIRGLLDDAHIESAKLTLKTDIPNISRLMYKGYIKMTFLVIIWLVCLYELFTVLNK